MLFIVSAVDLDTSGGDAVEVEVRRADGQKCARCWRTVPSVSSEPATEGLCDRCVTALSGTAN